MPSIEKRVKKLEKRVAEIAAREAIRELTAEYCRNVVRDDADAMVGLFTEDGSVRTNFPDGSGRDNLTPRGPEQLREAYSGLEAMQLRPCVHNHIIEVDGDSARGFCSVEIRLVQKGVPYTGAGHYEDTYRCVDGDWRFQHRELVLYHWTPHTKGWA